MTNANGSRETGNHTTGENNEKSYYFPFCNSVLGSGGLE